MPSGIRTRTSGIMVNVAMLPSVTASNPIQDLINGLTADGVFAKLDRLWVFAQATEALALVDLVAGATATAVNSPTFTANRGYTGEDAVSPTKYIDTGYNPFTDGINYTTNSAHLSAWCVGNVASVNGGCLAGNQDGAKQTDMFDTFTDGNIYVRTNSDGAAPNLGPPATRAGHWIGNTNAANTEQVYQNGSLFGTPIGDTTAGPINFKFFALCRSESNIAKFGAPNQVAMVSMGGSLNATDALNFYSRLRTYMTAVGVP